MNELQVIPIEGEPNRFMVVSGPNTYLIDMDEFKGIGKCGCQHFEFRIEPKLTKGEEVEKLCKHIDAVVAFKKANQE